MTTMQEINKICLILDSNKNKINILRNFLSKNYIRNNNVINKINQFINNFEIDIDNILSILDNLKLNLKKSGKSLNNVDNNLKFCNNITTTRCCHCCGCFHCCNCYQNYCCDNTNYKTISSNYNNSNEFKNFENSENNENINNINDEFKLYQNLNNPYNAYNYNTNPNLNFDYYSLINNQNNKNSRKNNSKGKIIYSSAISPNKSYNTINNTPNKNYKTIYNSPKKNSNLKNKKKAYIENRNLPNNEEEKNLNAIISSRRFHISKSFNNKRIKKILPKNKNNKKRKSPIKNKRKNISKKAEIFINKLNKQNDEILSRFKGVYGDDIEQKILNNEVRDENINEMNNILDKIIKMSIWGENNNNKRKMMNNSSNKKRKNYMNYNFSDESMPTLRDINNRKINFREFPRGWNSTKEYFINNGTPLF